MPQRLQFMRISDGALIKLWEALVDVDPEGTATLNAGDSWPLTWKHGERLLDPIKDTLNAKSFFVATASVTLPGEGFSLSYYRGQTFAPNANPGYGPSWQPNAENPFIDGFEITGPSKNAKRLTILKLVKDLVAFAPPTITSSQTEGLLDQSSIILNRISDAAATVVEHTVERQRNLDAFRIDLQKEAAERQSADRAEIERERDAWLDEAARKEKALADRAEALDDRENTHVRRELQKSMGTIATTALEKPLLASSQRSFAQTEIVAIGFAVLLIVLAAVQSISLQIGPSSRDLLWFGEARVLALGIGAASLIWYALRLSGSRHRQIGRWENDLNRFRLDTERASFLIEGDLEARKLSKEGLPDVMLDRFSRGLFSGSSIDEGTADDAIGSTLAHLLSRAASVKVGTDGVSVDVDKAGVKKARKEVARDAAGDN